MITVYVCSKCGDNSMNIDNIDDWLIASRPNHPGEMVIRCPDCITEYAIRKAGGHIEDGHGVVGAWHYELSPQYFNV
jgi:DNA-directed RNA polymerase subunit RPC12/RpoP